MRRNTGHGGEKLMLLRGGDEEWMLISIGVYSKMEHG